MLEPGQQALVDAYGSKPWFHSVGKDQYGRHVVYIKYSCHETLNDIMDYSLGKQVMVHFASYAEASREKFSDVQKPKLQAPPEVVVVTKEETDLRDDLDFLDTEIFALKRICGEDNLVDILYEIHDPRNNTYPGFTVVSKEFPEARTRLEKLYDKFGCDVLFGELE